MEKQWLNGSHLFWLIIASLLVHPHALCNQVRMGSYTHVQCLHESRETPSVPCGHADASPMIRVLDLRPGTHTNLSVLMGMSQAVTLTCDMFVFQCLAVFVDGGEEEDGLLFIIQDNSFLQEHRWCCLVCMCFYGVCYCRTSNPNSKSKSLTPQIKTKQ